MPFTLLPVLAAMRELYAQPRNPARFHQYLKLLEGNSSADLNRPVMHFNPMAKEALVAKLDELLALDAEAIATETLARLNAVDTSPAGTNFRVALNLADDVQGGWTNRFTTDYANTFELSALIKRGFCTPVFWASESYSAELVRERTAAQVWRTRYRLLHAPPRTVAAHLAQECFVARQLGRHTTEDAGLLAQLQARFTAVRAADDRPALLTFFYGDKAARQLGYREWGHWPDNAGFRLARACPELLG